MSSAWREYSDHCCQYFGPGAPDRVRVPFVTACSNPSRTGSVIALECVAVPPAGWPVPAQPALEDGRRPHRRRGGKGRGARSWGSGGQWPVGPSGSPSIAVSRPQSARRGSCPDYGAGASLGFGQACRRDPGEAWCIPKAVGADSPQEPRTSKEMGDMSEGRTTGWASRIPSGSIGIAFLAGLLVAGSFHLPLTTSAQQPSPRNVAGQPSAPSAAPVPGAAALNDLSQAFAAVAEQVKPSVVFIKSGKREKTRAVGGHLASVCHRDSSSSSRGCRKCRALSSRRARAPASSSPPTATS